MIKVAVKEVGNIIRWHETANVGMNYVHNDMSLKYHDLIVAWESLKQGIANENQQKLCYEIHKCLMYGLAKEDKVPLMFIGSRVESLVNPDLRFTERTPMKVSQAINVIANMDGRTPESVRKHWNKWQKATHEEREKVINIFMNSKQADFK